MVVQLVVDGGSVDVFWDFFGFILKSGFVFSLFFFGKVIVVDVLVDKFEVNFFVLGWYQIVIVDGFFDIVGEGGVVYFVVKQFIGVFICLIFGCGGQAQQQCVEVFKDCIVFLVN